MSKPTRFVGFDLASKSFTASFCRSCKDVFFLGNFDNELEGFKELLRVFKENKITRAKSVICMEATGVYGLALCHFLYKEGFSISVEPPLRVKRAFKTSAHKTDKIDSLQIAEYACRYVDKLGDWAPKAQVLSEMEQLFTLREHFVKQKTSLINSLQATMRNPCECKIVIELTESKIASLAIDIKTIEKKMKSLMQVDIKHAETAKNLLSICGVGPMVISIMFIVTEGFTKNLDYRKLSAYFGFCAYKHESGTSVRKKDRSRKYGPRAMRKVFHMAAKSMMEHDKRWAKYKEEKMAEGKVYKLVNNNVRNKLLKIMCAIIKSGKPFIAGYTSVRPNFL